LKKKGVILAAFAVLAVNAFSQTAFDYLTESLSNVLAVSDNMSVADYEYNGDNAIWGAYLEPGKSIARDLQYDAGVEYLMFAAADTTQADIYLKVYQGQGTGGTVIKQDTTRPVPIVRFTPSTSGWYCFELRNVSKIPAFVALVVLKHRKNAHFSLSTLAEARNNIQVVSRHLASWLPPKSGIPANKWALFGGSIRQGSAASYGNTQLVKGDYLLVGAGENSVSNCDVEVIEQYTGGITDGRKIPQQNTSSRYPFDLATFSADPSKYYYLRAINQSSRNVSSLLLGLLILKK